MCDLSLQNEMIFKTLSFSFKSAIFVFILARALHRDDLIFSLCGECLKMLHLAATEKRLQANEMFTIVSSMFWLARGH